ncbi:MAG: NapC/NirT family cytochrome c [Candidatus Acidiferrales bacterium]|jgi:nitrate/TMAO reductase-like tetraheme cytochrome c subunit
MNVREYIASWFRPAAYLGNNTISLAGAVITTTSAITLLGFWALELFGGGSANPYLGLILLLILPGAFVLGLILMPIGVLLRRHELARAGEIPHVYPQIDFTKPVFREAASWVAGLTIANLVIFGIASYRGVEYMDSARFCGQTCHTVMQPEFTAYQQSPHQRVSCVQCHIGPGAGWFVRSKVSGVRQIVAVAFHTYERPIPTPVEQLRPARETCEQCHWPQRFTGDKFIVRTKYSDDEKNTALITVLLLKVGGRTFQGSVGIHGMHLNDHSRVQYISTDRQRQLIPEVDYLDDSGKTVQFVSTDLKAAPRELAVGEHRTMDCVDCHNRPTHVFQLPDRAVDEAMSEGRISPELPFIKKTAVRVLNVGYPDRDTASSRIETSLQDWYRTSYPSVYRDKRALVNQAASQVQAIYLRNVFPAMKITWGTYPNNLGHTDSLGCFRCHDGSHKSSDGRVIPNDCDTCHQLLAIDEANPKVLTDLGMK